MSMGFSNCRHSAADAPIESQEPVRIDSLQERTGFEPPSPVDSARIHPHINPSGNELVAFCLNRCRIPSHRRAYDSKGGSGFQDWLSGGNRAMCVSACEGGGQSMSRSLSEREREKLAGEIAIRKSGGGARWKRSSACSCVKV